MRTCYIVQSHREPDQVLRLVRTIKLGSPTSLVHVSHDVRGPALDLEALRSLEGVEVNRAQGGYGDFTHVERYLTALEWARDQAVSLDWIVNLTGQCYPLRPLSEIERELDESDADAYLEYFDAFGPSSRWPVHRARSRYLFQHRRLIDLRPEARRWLRPLQAANQLQPWVRLHVSYGLTLGVRRRSLFGPDYRLHGGSAYASLNWPCAMYVLEQARSRPEVCAAFRHALSPEEAIIQTVLVNAGRFRLVNDSKRYFDFTGSRYNHPRLLGIDDLPAALASGAHFGRKFDLALDPDVFDRLDLEVFDGLAPRGDGV